MQMHLLVQRRWTSLQSRWISYFTSAWCKQPAQRPLGSLRQFGFQSIPTLVVPPIVFTGLLLSLWFYKCCMMIAFQNKIIYMPFIPPFARSEKLADYQRCCKPVEWREHRIKASDGTSITLVVGNLPMPLPVASRIPRMRTIIVYFQGNASSLPPRLPYLSQVVSGLQTLARNDDTSPSYTIVALSYRGFWTSKGRPSQKGIELDTDAALDWIQFKFESPDSNFKVILWGQSLGAGVASIAAARYMQNTSSTSSPRNFKIDGLLLETPFLNLRRLLEATYPQRWLPYRYLWPFLRSRWDSKKALTAICSLKVGTKPKVLILQAGKDELVPSQHGLELESLCHSRGIQVSRIQVPGALHTEIVAKEAGRRFIASFIRDVSIL